MDKLSGIYSTFYELPKFIDLVQEVSEDCFYRGHARTLDEMRDENLKRLLVITYYVQNVPRQDKYEIFAQDLIFKMTYNALLGVSDPNILIEQLYKNAYNAYCESIDEAIYEVICKLIGSQRCDNKELCEYYDKHGI